VAKGGGGYGTDATVTGPKECSLICGSLCNVLLSASSADILHLHNIKFFVSFFAVTYSTIVTTIRLRRVKNLRTVE
jgi:hypothetical protein